MASSSDTSRRDLVKTAGIAAAGFTIVNASAVRGTAQNSKVQIGLLGAGRRGSRVSRYFVQNENSEMTALADVYDNQLEESKKTLKIDQIQTYKSAAAILDADIDAVYIATPPWLHPEHFELAVDSGKHILMEKPVAVDPAGVRRVLSAAKRLKPGQIVVVDFQQRYGNHYIEAFNRLGEIGEIGMVRSAWIGGGLPLREGHDPSEEKVRNWLFYKERGGDIIVEQNCHNFDVVRWFTGVHPVSASGFAHRAFRTNIGDIVDTFAVNYKLPDGRVYTHSGNQICARGGYRDVGEYFMGRDGVISTTRQGYHIQLGGEDPVFRKADHDITKDVIDKFVQGVRGEIPARNDVVEACESTLAGIMGRIAYETERTVTWDEVINM